MFGALAHSPIVPVLSSTSFQPIDVRDVAERLVRMADSDEAGRVQDLGGPEVRPMADLARVWLSWAGKRRSVLSVRVPGSLARAFRDGANLTPEHAGGPISFGEYLAGRAVLGTNPAGPGMNSRNVVRAGLIVLAVMQGLVGVWEMLGPESRTPSARCCRWCSSWRSWH